MKEYNFFKQDALRPTEEQRLLTKQFYQNSVEIYARFDDWKDIDKFYFIPLYLEMTYSCGWVAEIAPDPVWLGSFVRCSLEHPDLFQYNCPDCGRPIHPYRYVGSPLSEALRAQIAADKGRYLKYKLLHPRAEPGSIEELLAD
jgi:hypothetical protein